MSATMLVKRTEAAVPSVPVRDVDRLAPVRGIATAVGLSVPMWALIIWAVRAVL